MLKKKIKNPYLNQLLLINEGQALFIDNLSLAPNKSNNCPLPQYLLQYALFPLMIEIARGIKKHNRPSHANKILKSPNTRYSIEDIHK